MLPLLILFTLAGSATTGYLIGKHYGPRRGPLVCPFGQACDVVLESRYGRILGVRNEVIGLGYYIITLALLIMAGQGTGLPFQFFGTTSALTAVLYLSIPAFLASLALTLVQVFILRNFCSYCLFANVLNAAIFLVLLFS